MSRETLLNALACVAPKRREEAYFDACNKPEALTRVRVESPLTLRNCDEARGVVLATAEKRWAERRAIEILEAMM